MFLPPLLLPQFERTQGPTVRQVLRQEFAQQALVRTSGGVGQWAASATDQEATERISRVGWQHASGRREPAAPLA